MSMFTFGDLVAHRAPNGLYNIASEDNRGDNADFLYVTDDDVKLTFRERYGGTCSNGLISGSYENGYRKFATPVVPFPDAWYFDGEDLHLGMSEAPPPRPKTVVEMIGLKRGVYKDKFIHYFSDGRGTVYTLDGSGIVTVSGYSVQEIDTPVGPGAVFDVTPVPNCIEAMIQSKRAVLIPAQ